MPISNIELYRALQTELARWGIDKSWCVIGKTHNKLAYEVGGRAFRYPFAKTPSDWRANKNEISDLRRHLREHGLTPPDSDKPLAVVKLKPKHKPQPHDSDSLFERRHSRPALRVPPDTKEDFESVYRVLRETIAIVGERLGGALAYDDYRAVTHPLVTEIVQLTNNVYRKGQESVQKPVDRSVVRCHTGQKKAGGPSCTNP